MAQIFKNGPSKICGRQPLKIWIDIVCLSIPYHFKLFKCCLPQILLGPFWNALSLIWSFFQSVVQVFIPAFLFIIKKNVWYICSFQKTKPAPNFLKHDFVICANYCWIKGFVPMSFEVSVRSARPYSTKWPMFLSDDGLMTRVERKLYIHLLDVLKRLWLINPTQVNLTRSCIMLKNDQTDCKNLAMFTPQDC